MFLLTFTSLFITLLVASQPYFASVEEYLCPQNGEFEDNFVKTDTTDPDVITQARHLIDWYARYRARRIFCTQR